MAALFFQSVFGQKPGVSGVVKDTTSNTNINLASIAVLNIKDSILQVSGRSNNQGVFNIPFKTDGDYILLISYPKYADYVELFSIENGISNNSQSINLMPAAKLLDEIVLTMPSMLIKGDTTEYVADSFKVRENATVEDLLKELPGIQVDKDGKIIAQGQQVQKVLVDGDEFFSDDPTVATKNIRADAVARVQVYDKKSDQAAFTGIDDGEEIKTIDLRLKDDAKKGYFGKASVAGLDKYYNGTAMLNSFRSKRKISVFGVASSTDQTGLSSSDQTALGLGGGGGGGGRGGGRGGSNSSAAGNFSGQGLPESIKVGGHYDDKWNGGKNSAGGDYLFNRLNIRSGSNTFSENTLQNSVSYTKSSSTNNSGRLQHSINGVTEINIDSTSQVKVTINGGKGNSDNRQLNHQEYLDDKSNLVNNSDTRNFNHGDNESFNTTAFYRKRFRKPGRTISINFNQRYNKSKTNGILENNAQFFDENGDIIREQNTNQNKINTNKNQTLEGRMSYTNPLGKNSYLEVNYSYNHNDNYQQRLSFDPDDNHNYTQLVDSVSSDFQYIYNTHTGGLNYRYSAKKLQLSFGGSLAHTGVEQQNNFAHSARSYGYNNLFPRANLNYRFSPFASLRFNYSGSTRQPTIDQIQPLNDNSDPLNIIVGNPDLKQSFSNTFSLNYNRFEMLKEQYIFAGINFSTTSNQINSTYTLDNFGKRTTMYINTDGNYSLNFFGSMSRKLSNTWRAGINPTIFLSRTTNFINGDKNISKSLNIGPNVNLNKRDVEKYELGLTYRPSYNSSKSSISSAADQTYWIQNISFDGRYTLPVKIDIGTSVSFEHRQKISADDTRNQVIYLNAFIEKRLLKKEQLTVRFSMNDILDQNRGYERVIQPNAVIERNYLTFQRYGLITISYNFNTTGAGSGNGSQRGHRMGRF